MHYVNANMCKVEAATLVQSLQSVASLRLKQQDRRADCRLLPVLYFLVVEIYFLLLRRGRAAAVARLPRSLLDPELFPHTAYVKILATLARKTVN